MNPIILSDNRFMDGVPDATGTATGYSPIHIRDLRPFTSWKAAASGTNYLTVDCGADATADSLGIFKHNLGTVGATVSVESSANGTDWTERLEGFEPSDDNAILVTFDSATARYWRIKIVTADAAPQIAIAILGERIDFPTPPDGPFVPAEEGVEADVDESKEGNYLGVTWRFSTVRVKPQWTNEILSRSFIDSTMRPWWRSHGRYLFPFFWAWDLTTYPTDVKFLRMTSGYVFKPALRTLARTDSFDLDMEGVVE